MKLELRRLVTPAHPSGEVLVLTDENGVMLTGQKSLSLDQGVGVDSVVTVELIVDGDGLRLNTGEEAERSS
jgi:hypothetical protein